MIHRASLIFASEGKTYWEHSVGTAVTLHGRAEVGASFASVLHPGIDRRVGCVAGRAQQENYTSQHVIQSMEVPTMLVRLRATVATQVEPGGIMHREPRGEHGVQQTSPVQKLALSASRSRAGPATDYFYFPFM
jgi:hypothetical protein